MSDTKQFTDANLDALLALEAKATPEPWHTTTNWVCPGQFKGAFVLGPNKAAIADVHSRGVGNNGEDSQDQCDSNATFIRFARNALRPLCLALRAEREKANKRAQSDEKLWLSIMSLHAQICGENAAFDGNPIWTVETAKARIAELESALAEADAVALDAINYYGSLSTEDMMDTKPSDVLAEARRRKERTQMDDTRDTSTKALIETMSFPWAIQNGVEGFDTYRDSHYIDKAEPREPGEECSVTIYKWLADAIVAALSREADLRRVAWGLATGFIQEAFDKDDTDVWIIRPGGGKWLRMGPRAGVPIFTKKDGDAARAAIDAAMRKENPNVNI